MATVNAVGNGLSGATGSGSFVGSTSPSLVTPVLGVPTSGTLTSCTGLPLTTGITASFSNGGIVYSGSSALGILAATATANLPLLSGSSTTPAWGSYALSLGGALTTAGAFTTSGAYGVTFTFTNTTSVTFPTSGTLATTGQLQSTVAASGSTQACAVNTTYYVTAAGGCVLTLPATAAAGSVVGVVGDGAGGWTLAPNSGQTIKIIGVSASTSVASAEQYDTIFVMCVVANTTWVAYSMTTSGFTYS